MLVEVIGILRYSFRFLEFPSCVRPDSECVRLASENVTLDLVVLNKEEITL